MPAPLSAGSALLCPIRARMPEPWTAVGATQPAARSAYREWVLPTYQQGDDRGHARELRVDPDSGRFRRTRRGDASAAQSLRLEVERFAAPELLFAPQPLRPRRRAALHLRHRGAAIEPHAARIGARPQLERREDRERHAIHLLPGQG